MVEFFTSLQLITIIGALAPVMALTWIFLIKVLRDENSDLTTKYAVLYTLLLENFEHIPPHKRKEIVIRLRNSDIDFNWGGNND